MNFKLQEKLLFITAILFLNLNIYAQQPFDCTSALEVCDSSTIEIDFEEVIGTEVENVTDFCSISSFNQSLLNENTVWLKYKFKTDGDFLFTISTTIEQNDIDFVVFKSETKTCDDLEAIRCMFTGSNFNSPTDPACEGPTGLSANSTDFFEQAGCLEGDDNFLAPIEVIEGDVLYLAVFAFSFLNTYTIEHSGSAEISCQVLSLEEKSKDEISIYPNPTRNLLTVDISNNNEVFDLIIYNSIGKKVVQDKCNGQTELNVEQLPEGIYFLKFQSNNMQEITKKFIKTR